MQLLVWSQFGIESRLATSIFNLSRLILTFTLAAVGSSSGQDSFFHSILLLSSFIVMLIAGIVRWFELVATIGKALDIRDDDLMFTQGLRDKIDAVCDKYDDRSSKYSFSVDVEMVGRWRERKSSSELKRSQSLLEKGDSIPSPQSFSNHAPFQSNPIFVSKDSHNNATGQHQQDQHHPPDKTEKLVDGNSLGSIKRVQEAVFRDQVVSQSPLLIRPSQQQHQQHHPPPHQNQGARL